MESRSTQVQETHDASTKRKRSRKRKRKRRSRSNGVSPEANLPSKNGLNHGPVDLSIKRQKTSVQGMHVQAMKAVSSGARDESPVSQDTLSDYRVATLHPGTVALEEGNTLDSTLVTVAAVDVLVTFTSRISWLQSNLVLYENRLKNMRQGAGHPFEILYSEDIVKKIIALAQNHLTELIVHEQALRDVFDEHSGDQKVLQFYGQQAIEEFDQIKRLYDEQHFPLLQALSPETMATTVNQMDVLDEEHGDGSPEEGDVGSDKENMDGLGRVLDRVYLDG